MLADPASKTWSMSHKPLLEQVAERVILTLSMIN